MSYQDHLKTCSYCRKESQPQTRKVTVSVKSTSSYYKQKKLSELSAIIKGVSYPGISYVDVKKTNVTKTKGASNVGNLPRKSNPLDRQFKLKELGRMIRGL